MVCLTYTWSTSTFVWLGKELFSSCYTEHSSWSCSSMGKGGGDAEMSGCLSWHLVPSPTGGNWWHLPAVRGQNHPVASRWSGSFEVVAASEHSFAVTNCSTCCDVPLLAPDVPPRPTVSLLGSPSPLILLTTSRSSSFIGQWWCQGSTRSFHLLNYPLLQDSSPHLLVGALLQVGF